MYLKSLEITGFKSFATKTVLNFHRGVTAVVGPNGCGKSNVLDAIRWVLGEQSAKALRGGEMADVIFNGAENRKPLGMAEVSLEFGDCEKELGTDFNEVRITRRVYRDGKAEYLLNKIPCRLRDIHEMFMDTGIGRTAYSIMEQGKIDLILSSRPEDRRAVFEEAAGITRYKAQKKEALRKLEYTEANLLRVTDIIKEVKRQIGSLQRQAGKARRYQSLMADLRTLDTHLSRKKYDAFTSELADIEDRAAKLEKKQLAVATTIEAGEAELRGYRGQVDVIEQALNEDRARAAGLRNEIATTEGRLGFNAERVSESSNLISRYRAEVSAIDEKLRVQEGQIEDTDQQLQALADTLETEKLQLQAENDRAAATRNTRHEAQQSLAKSQREANDHEAAVIRSKAELTSTENQLESGRSRLASLESEIAEIASQNTTIRVRNEDSRAAFTSARTRLENESTALRNAESALSAARESLRALVDQLSAAEREHAEKVSRLRVLEQLNEAGEGFATGTQAILKGLDRPDVLKPAIIGALANLIEVDPDHILAVEAALGQNLQAIIVKDTEVAREALRSLVASRKGRASLSTPEILPRPKSTQIEAMPPGAIAWAFDRVKAVEQVRPLLARLLGDVAIVPDLDTAMDLRRDFSHLAFATLTGETISRDGIITGGQADDSGASILRRKNEIRQLSSATEAASVEIGRLAAGRDAAENAVATMAEKVDSLRADAQNARVAASTLEGQLQLMERELRENLGKQESLGWEQKNLLETLDNAAKRTADLRAKIEGHETSLDAVRRLIFAGEEEIRNLAAEEEQVFAALNDLRVRVATSLQQHESLVRQRSPMTQRVAELTDLHKQRTKDIADYEERIEALGAQTTQLREQIKEANASVEAVDQTVSEIAARRTGLVESLGQWESNLSSDRRELTLLQQERGKLEVQQTQISLRAESLCENITRRYHVDLREFCNDFYALHVAVREQQKRPKRVGIADSDHETQPDAATPEVREFEDTDGSPPAEQPIDWELIDSMVAELTERVDAMGPVNIDAIQEFEELEERHKFLEDQFNDLTNSKTELLGVIAKINATTRELFAGTFEQVRVNFQEMFSELFGGGKANLLLADDSDPLECGIEIIARPPGKELRSISLLSGGEKTMTAVSLLFAIYMVKPSPFCVLDEMDAPLDESNINRFIKILDRFVQQSQFVVITHNKRTIAKADVLYGVTMEEHGVSKLVGVKLTQRGENQSGELDVLSTSEASHHGNNPADAPGIAESFGKSDKLLSENQPAT